MSNIEEEFVSLSKYACTLHTGAGKLSYRMVDLDSMTIISRSVGTRKSDKPEIHSDGSVSYLDINEQDSVEMWVNQSWADTEDSAAIRLAREHIKKRCIYLDKYKPSDDVQLVSKGKTHVVVTVPYNRVMAYLAQRPMFCVSADKPIVHDEEELEHEEEELEHEEEELEEEEDELEASSMSSSFASNEKKQVHGRKKPVVHALTPDHQPPKSPESTKPVSRKKQHAVKDTKVYGTKRVHDDDNDDVVSSKRTVAKTQAKTQDQPQAKTQAKTQDQPQAKTQAKTQDQPQAKTRAKTQDQPQAKTQDQPQAKTQDQPQAKTQDQPQAKTQDQPQAKTQDQTQDQAQDPPRTAVVDFESADVLRAIIEHLAMDAVKHCNTDDIAKVIDIADTLKIRLVRLQQRAD